MKFRAKGIQVFFGLIILLSAVITGITAQKSTELVASSVTSSADLSKESVNLSLSSADNSTFYTIRPDMRRCMSPVCGGFFVKRVNLAKTQCANGGMAEECYVAEIDWNGQPQVEAGRALLRGTIVVTSDKRFGKLGTLRVTESWQSANQSKPNGDFFRARDRGLRCITFPCLTHLEAKLNSNASQNIAGVDISGAHASDDIVSDAHTALTGREGIMVAGSHERVIGPGGRSVTLKASQFY